VFSCNHPRTITDENEGEIICSECGAVVDRVIDAPIIIRRRKNRERVDYRIQTPKEKHFIKAEDLLYSVKDHLDLTNGLYDMAYDYYKRAYALGLPCRGKVKTRHHFYTTECMAACIYIATLEKGKKYKILTGLEKKQYRTITTKDVQRALNDVILNTEYKTQITSRRIEQCARVMVNEFRLKDIPETPPIINRQELERKHQIKNQIKSAMSDIHDKLGMKCFDRALGMLEYYIKSKNFHVIVKGQTRKPEVVAAAFIYLACKKTKEKTTLQRLKEATEVNHESLQKVFKDLKHREKIFHKSN
jgi:transcription initiation factor TFIIIB Brf1 subunit/transcription initiation factor TFIIB